MISLSNLIKSSRIIPLDEHKRLEHLHLYEQKQESLNDSQEPTVVQPDEETILLRDHILKDAQYTAEARIREAAEESGRLLTEAQQQIDVWWLERRNEDEQLTEEARQAGYMQGLTEGREEARVQVEQEWSNRINEATQLLKSAYEMKEQIIQEAEPFLIELSCSIASKIIGEQLQNSEHHAIELIRKALSRRREQGIITLCVAPSQLAFVQAARDELQLATDSQAELQILPDSSVTDHGCVIRSAFGSIDARIDTQLEEIKRELLQLCHQSMEEDREREGYE